jgi:hypothetical protein
MYWPPRARVTNNSELGDVTVIQSDNSSRVIGPGEAATFHLSHATGLEQLVISGGTDVNIKCTTVKGATTDPIQVTESDNTVTILALNEDHDFVLGTTDQLIVDRPV